MDSTGGGWQRASVLLLPAPAEQSPGRCRHGRTVDRPGERDGRCTVVPATGMAVRTLDAPGIEPLVGADIYNGAAPTEAAAYRGQDVFVAGSANSAGQGP
jgi:thioredoxin reductase (NADPH)